MTPQVKQKLSNALGDGKRPVAWPEIRKAADALSQAGETNALNHLNCMGSKFKYGGLLSAEEVVSFLAAIEDDAPADTRAAMGVSAGKSKIFSTTSYHFPGGTPQAIVKISSFGTETGIVKMRVLAQDGTEAEVDAIRRSHPEAERLLAEAQQTAPARPVVKPAAKVEAPVAKDFPALVREYVSPQVALADAVTLAMRNHPDEHREWLAQGGGSLAAGSPVRSASPAPKSRLAEIVANLTAGGLDQCQAVEAAKRDHPGEFASYLATGGGRI